MKNPNLILPNQLNKKKKKCQLKEQKEKQEENELDTDSIIFEHLRNYNSL